MDAEEIVRRLAGAVEPRADYGEAWGEYCTLCAADMPLDNNESPLTDHKPSCPWRLAVEWVNRKDVGP